MSSTGNDAVPGGAGPPLRAGPVPARSLSARLLAGAAAAIAIALLLTALVIALLFERHVERNLAADLEAVLAQIEGGLDTGADGALLLRRPPGDPRFAEPFGGLYWQVVAPGAELRSRSLWDERLPQGDAPPPGERRVSTVPGPGGQTVMLAERGLVFGPAPGIAARIQVAADLAQLRALRDDFALEMAAGLSLLWLALMAGALAQIRLGLAPLADLRARVAALRDGARGIAAGGPPEVAPLVDEINTLLAARDAATEQARRRAADLAHGLKTPLAALGADAERLARRGETELAADIARSAEDMRRHVERQLVFARLAGSGAAAGPGGRADVGVVVSGLAATLARTPDGARVRFEQSGPDLAVPVAREDLMDCLGNLMENAARHAVSVVAVGWTGGPGWSVTVEDDGPGIAPERRALLMRRGVRLDEQGTGAGLGLAIAHDIAKAYGLTLTLGVAARGGLAARLAAAEAAADAAEGLSG